MDCAALIFRIWEYFSDRFQHARAIRKYKSFISENGEEVYGGTYYWLQDAPPSDNKIFIVRMYDGEQIVRCVMLSHYDNDLHSAHNASSTLEMYFPFDVVGKTYAVDN